MLLGITSIKAVLLFILLIRFPPCLQRFRVTWLYWIFYGQYISSRSSLPLFLFINPPVVLSFFPSASRSLLCAWWDLYCTSASSSCVTLSYLMQEFLSSSLPFLPPCSQDCHNFRLKVASSSHFLSGFLVNLFISLFPLLSYPIVVFLFISFSPSWTLLISSPRLLLSCPSCRGDMLLHFSSCVCGSNL